MVKSWFDAYKRGSCDIFLLAVILLLAGCGICMLFSVSYLNAIADDRAASHYLMNQLTSFAGGAVFAVLLTNMSLSLIRKLIPIGTIVCVLMNFLPMFYPEINGAKRWILIPGFPSIQPSEFLKVAVILYLAWNFVKMAKKQSIDYRHSFCIAAVSMLIVFFIQSDLSTCLFIFALCFSMMAVSQLKTRCVIIAGIVLLVLFFALVFTGDRYRIERILGHMNQTENTKAENYQISASKNAISSGGLWGRGIGNGVYKNEGRLPEAKSDFIFAVTGEELGFIGVLCIIACFVFFAVRGYMGALLAVDPFCAYVAFGVTTCIFFQALLNITVVSGLLPVTGIPLPFFSQGGSSMLATMIMCGLLLNVTRREIGG